MKGLLKKELINMRSSLRIMGILALFFFAMGFVQKSVEGFLSMAVGFTAMLSIMIPVTSMSCDASCQWDYFALSMPLCRKSLVASKYLLTVALSAACMGLSMLLGLFLWALEPSQEPGELFLALLGVFLLAIVLLSVLLPLIYQFGLEKARFVLIGIGLLPGLIITMGFQSGWFSEGKEISSLDGGSLLAVGALAAAVILVGSYLLSVRIFTRKDI